MLIQGKYRCINCFEELNSENDQCSCGFNEAGYKVLPHVLAPGTILNDMYCVGRVIGEGGFGITYVGFDINLEMQIAIKEFYMNGFNSRSNTVSNAISVSYGDSQELFDTNREKFVKEGRILAQVNKNDGVVSVYTFFKANNTAYIIMEYLDGQDLKSYLKQKGNLTVKEVSDIFLPIMNTLDKIHTKNLIHRDISPDNIIFTKEGKVKLIDFGAAREASNGNKSLSVVLKHGFAPPEQYQSRGNQGPWTDVYALSATIYKCLTGVTPPEAVDRMFGQELVPVNELIADCSKAFSDVIMKGLEVNLKERYQTMREMADALKEACEGKPYVPVAQPENTANKTVYADDTQQIPEVKEEPKREAVIPTKPTVQIDINNIIHRDYAYLANVKVGDVVVFGNFRGNRHWRVLNIGKNSITLIANRIIAEQPFDSVRQQSNWTMSTLRQWLNTYFYTNSFSEEERSFIMNSNIDGNGDKVFILSKEEALELFNGPEDMEAEFEGNARHWWLRAPMVDKGELGRASGVFQQGIIDGMHIDYNYGGVRPVINIELSKL